MAFKFSRSDIQKLGKVLGVSPKHKGNNYRFEIGRGPQQRPLTLEIYPNIPIGKRSGNLVSIYTPSAHLQLHFCTGYVISHMLNEVTFVGEQNGKISGIIVEREGGCSLYANVDRALLSGDFTQMGPEIMLSGIALSLTESILPDQAKRSPKNRK